MALLVALKQGLPDSMARTTPSLHAVRALLLLALAARTPAHAGGGRGVDAVPPECLVDAAVEMQVPVETLKLLLTIEGGRVGECSQNTNRTRDCGPAQINSLWFPKIAGGRVPPAEIEHALTFDACYNVRIAAWILRREIDAVGWANFWTGVGNYHSRTPRHHQRYLSRIIAAARRAGEAR